MRIIYLFDAILKAIDRSDYDLQYSNFMRTFGKQEWKTFGVNSILCITECHLYSKNVFEVRIARQMLSPMPKCLQVEVFHKVSELQLHFHTHENPNF